MQEQLESSTSSWRGWSLGWRSLLSGRAPRAARRHEHRARPRPRWRRSTGPIPPRSIRRTSSRRSTTATALQARHRLPLQGRPRDDPADRRRGRHASDQADPRHHVHRRPGHGLRAREPGRADLRLVRPGQAGQRLVHGRGLARAASTAASSRPATRGSRASTAPSPGSSCRRNPQPGDAYRQEYYPPGQALDEAHVLGRRRAVKVPYGSFKRVLVTSEFSPLEPQTEQKYYVAGRRRGRRARRQGAPRGVPARQRDALRRVSWRMGGPRPAPTST